MKETEQKIVTFIQSRVLSRNYFTIISIGKRVAIPNATYLKTIKFFCYNPAAKLD